MTHDTTTLSHNTDLHIKPIQGSHIPALGFGTWKLKGKDCQTAVETALDIGYRHIDTARMYENEEAVGQALQSTTVPREELWVTSKVWMEDLAPDRLKNEVAESLRLLQTDYLDLALIHWPNPKLPLEASIQAFAELQQAGKIRHYGVSNFPPHLLKEAMAYGDIFCNQVEYHPFLSQDSVLAAARPHDVLVTAYCPLAQGKAIEDPVLKTIGEKYGKNPGQITLRWLIEQDRVAAIPRSSSRKHIQDNFNIFDFQLDAEDIKNIEALPKDQRLCNPAWAPNWGDA